MKRKIKKIIFFEMMDNNQFGGGYIDIPVLGSEAVFRWLPLRLSLLLPPPVSSFPSFPLFCASGLV